MFKNIPVLLPLVLVICFSLPAWTPGTKASQEAGSAQFDTNREQIGGLRLGLAGKELDGKISCSPKMGKEILEGATGEYVQTWKYPECGVELKMSSGRKGAVKTVASITVTSPSDLATGKGLHLGSTESEVVSAYGRYRDHDGFTKKGIKFVAGSVYDGMIFDFKDGKVVKIFLGAAAE